MVFIGTLSFRSGIKCMKDMVPFKNCYELNHFNHQIGSPG